MSRRRWPAAGRPTATGRRPPEPTWDSTPKDDLTGNFEYQAAGSKLNIHCNDYDFYVQTTSANGKYPKSLVNSHNCFDKDGNAYFLHAEFVDRGEPGVRDKACITFKAADGSVAVYDCGVIQSGNIQIH